MKAGANCVCERWLMKSLSEIGPSWKRNLRTFLDQLKHGIHECESLLGCAAEFW